MTSTLSGQLDGQTVNGTPAPQLPAPAANRANASTTPASPPPATAGAAVKESWRVRRMRRQLATKKAFGELSNDPTWTEADSPRVIREKEAAAEASKLHKLGRNPQRQALSAARWRKALTVAVAIGLVCALGWSTANVQSTVAAGAEMWGARWLLAYLVEPFISLFLLTMFAFQAFMATKDVQIADRRIKRSEAVFLSITLSLNVWPHLTAMGDSVWFHLFGNHVFAKVSSELLDAGVSAIGPVAAVMAIQTVPVIWKAINELDHGTSDIDLVEKLTAVRHMIAMGTLPENPNRSQIQRAFQTSGEGIDVRVAQRVHRCLTGRTDLL